jgi:glycosyltransferase involved in cell wall biosynthesis
MTANTIKVWPDRPHYPKFSIIIPYFNAQDTIQQCVDSVFRQELSSNDFEIIIVDDCSSSPEAWKYLLQLKENDKYAQHLQVLRQEQNSGPGGARNRGIATAKGDYIIYIDADDWLSDGALSKLKKQLDEVGDLDLLMYDAYECKNGQLQYVSNFDKNSTEIQKGEDYICTQAIPWTPWCCAYNRRFILHHQAKFVENTRFEDADYVMTVILLAERMAFNPTRVNVHRVFDAQASAVGCDFKRIQDLFHIAWRLVGVANRFKGTCPKGAAIVMSHHYFMYKQQLLKLLWRLSVSQILSILSKYPAEANTKDWLLRFSIYHPRCLAYTMVTLRPLLNVMWRVKQMLKR